MQKWEYCLLSGLDVTGRVKIIKILFYSGNNTFPHISNPKCPTDIFH